MIYAFFVLGLSIGTMLGLFIAGLMGMARERDRKEQIAKAERWLRDVSKR